MNHPHPIVVDAFCVVRHLNQLVEALAVGMDDDALGSIRRLVVDCADRAEHIAQEFLPDSFGTWPEKERSVRESLLAAINWLIEVVALDWVQDALSKSLLARPTRDQLSALAASLRDGLLIGK